MAELAQRGQLGDTSIWEEAEQRWENEGVTLKDVLKVPEWLAQGKRMKYAGNSGFCSRLPYTRYVDNTTHL
jgi:hypothetical protein